MSSDAAATSDVRTARVGPLFIAAYALAYTGIWLALLTPIVVTISLRVRELTPTHAAQKLALVLSIGAAFALFAGPLFGYLSDGRACKLRTATSRVRRRFTPASNKLSSAPAAPRR